MKGETPPGGDDTGAKIETGVRGLDRVLDGGLPAGRTYLVEGEPGTGKTTLALQSLVHAARQGRRGLIVSVAQSEEELASIAASHGMSLDGIDIVSPQLADHGAGVSVSTESADLQALLDTAVAAAQEYRPDLFVFDSLLELRLLSASPIDFRRKLLHLQRVARDLGATTLLLDHSAFGAEESFERGTVHGSIQLRAAAPSIGQIERTLNILKMRGATFREGLHDFRIRHGGLEVFPRVIPSERGETTLTNEQIRVTEPALNEMLGGGLELGTSLLIAGQSGSGKSTLSTLIATSAAAVGKRASLFLFEERPEVFRSRSTSLGMSLDGYEAEGRITMNHFEPAETSPGALSRHVIDEASSGSSVIVLDSLTGYLSALPARDNAETHLHALIQYLTRQGCLVVLTVAQQGLMGEPPSSDMNASYLADAIIMLRQYPSDASIRRSLAVLKKRHSEHERGIEELIIRPGHVHVSRIAPDVQS
ncbi:circadian clock protein KaiC [Tranquillimonas rosea]|uniref:non-specific serine/threonine protein kinase n=1 Tax=Tranquillimonas rosea TaxID=641238 RepID=A0A1H9TFP7_9RHOB|nr:ATPase domain-containing protein [Tranquillimonas rosea]SER95433.1 circadian clock protein KaiC [Tranquillimonas rosea]